MQQLNSGHFDGVGINTVLLCKPLSVNFTTKQRGNHHGVTHFIRAFFGLDCRVPGDLICVFKCSFHCPAVTKFKILTEYGHHEISKSCRCLSLMHQGKFNFSSTSGVQDCGSNSFAGLHFRYYSMSGVRDCGVSSFTHLTLIYCSTSGERDCGRNSFKNISS